MKKIRLAGFVVLTIAGFLSCVDNDSMTEENNVTVEHSYTFDADTEGWEGGFAGYPPGDTTVYELKFERTSLPESTGTGDGALMLSGQNASQDLFMFAKKPVTDLIQSKTYQVEFTVEYTLNFSGDTISANESSGPNLWMKIGATTVEPQAIDDGTDLLIMNIDKGDQGIGGADMVVVDEISSTGSNEFPLKSVTNEELLYVTTDYHGQIWLIAGVESGIKSTTAVYFNSVKVVLIPVVDY